MRVSIEGPEKLVLLTGKAKKDTKNTACIDSNCFCFLCLVGEVGTLGGGGWVPPLPPPDETLKWYHSRTPFCILHCG